MAKSHTTNGVYTNPEVRFERSDIEAGEIVRAGLLLAVVLTGTAVVAVSVGWWLTRAEANSKRTTLPPAAIDKEGPALPPQPRLEALEDLGDPKKPSFVIYPDRASEYYHDQRELLRQGDAKTDIEPIAAAINQLAGKLPARKDAPPQAYGVALPSKAAAGRVSTGAQ